MLRKIRCLQDLLEIPDRNSPVVTLFSGGLDSSYLLSYLYEAGFTRLVAFCADLGEGIETEELTRTTQRFGAELVIEDLREQFCLEYVKPALKAHARYLDIFPISSSLARPLIAKTAVRIARERGAAAVLHTANQSQNSLRRLNTAILGTEYDGFFGSPYEYSAITRDDKAQALTKYGLTFFTGRHLSGDANLWCREFESGSLDNPESFTLPEDSFTWTRRKAGMPSSTVALSFERGELTCVNGRRMPFAAAIALLNDLVGGYGHGRFVGLEHLDEGEKVLEVREAPAAFILMRALRHLETATLTANAIALKQSIERVWALEAVEGRWASDIKNAAEAGIVSLCDRVNGTVQFALNYQDCQPESIRAEKPLYIVDRDRWEVEAARLPGTRSFAGYWRNAPAGIDIPAAEI